LAQKNQCLDPSAILNISLRKLKNPITAQAPQLKIILMALSAVFLDVCLNSFD